MKKVKRSKRNKSLMTVKSLDTLQGKSELKRLEDFLTLGLAAYVLAQADQPLKITVNKLMEMEIEAARLVDSSLHAIKDGTKTSLTGTLAGTLSFTRFGSPPKPTKILNSRQSTKTPNKATFIKRKG